MPEFDFKGRQLQQFGLGVPAQQIALNGIQLDAGTCLGIRMFQRTRDPGRHARRVVYSNPRRTQRKRGRASLIFPASPVVDRHRPRKSLLGSTKRLPHGSPFDRQLHSLNLLSKLAK